MMFRDHFWRLRTNPVAMMHNVVALVHGRARSGFLPLRYEERDTDMNGLWAVAEGMLVLAAGSWLAMVVKIRGTGACSTSPWRIDTVLKDYAALRDLGLASGLWPNLLLLACVVLLTLVAFSALLR